MHLRPYLHLSLSRVSRNLLLMKSFHENPTNGSVADKNRGHIDGHGLHVSSYAFISSRTPNNQLVQPTRGGPSSWAWARVWQILTIKSAYYKTLHMASVWSWLWVFKNGVLREIFGSKVEEVTGDWRKLRNEHHDLYCSQNHVWSSRTRWAGRMAYMGDKRNA
jgi:hypothetical protein